MALTRTTLTAAIRATDLTIPVASTATGFPAVGVILNPQQLMLIDDETMFVVYVPMSGVVVVRSRGSDGSAAQAHDVGAPVVTSPQASDFPALIPGLSVSHPVAAADNLTYGQDQAIAVPVIDMTVAFLSKATAGAFTLGAPSLASTGLRLVLTSTTAAAHVVTATGLLLNGATGGPFSSVTFPAFAGASVTLLAQNGSWNVMATVGTMTFA